MLRITLFSCLLFIAFFAQGAFGQTGNRQQQCRQTSIYVQCGNVGDDEETCLSNQFCCWNATIEPSCYANMMSTSQQQSNNIARSLSGSITPPENATETVRALGRSLGGLGISANAEAQQMIEGRIIGFGGLVASTLLPECAVRTPFCQRVACNAQNPQAQSDPFQCLSDPSCCFDGDLFIYRAVFGSAFMNGAPVCYYGPTSSRYRQIAALIQPYNAFFQTAIVNIFQEYLDTGLAFQERAICVFTNAAANTGLFGTQCGWTGITELECQLKGCCFSDTTNQCSYPQQNALTGNLNSNEFYPELVAQSPDEINCNTPTTLTANVFQRLPCRSPTTATNVEITPVLAYFLCPETDCCRNQYGLIPGLFELNLASTGGFGLNPFTPSISPFLALQIPSLAGSLSSLNFNQFFCPYLFFPFPGFPDLTNSVAGCCNQHVCYHRKQGGPPTYRNWSQWGACSAQCGTGQRRRTRLCADFAGNQASTCFGPSFEDGPCQGNLCCQWTQWQSFGCNAQCGGFGTEGRSRQCRDTRTNGPCNSCPGSGSEQRQCQRLTNCGQWSNWNSWGRCSRSCGGNGIRSRSRSCFVSQTGQSSNTCPGLGTEQDSCQAPSCCQFTNWSTWTNCGVTCGSGSQTRNRQCIDNFGQFCNSCSGSRSENRACQLAPCCRWTNYGQWSTCNAGCGQTGTETRSRNCITPNGGQCNSCPGSATTSRPCQGTTCCSWSNYGPYSSCNAPCDRQGSQTRTRVCQSTSGAPCSSFDCLGSDTDSQVCFGGPCFGFSDWTTWGACTSGCNRERNRYCQAGSQRVDYNLCSDSNPRVERNACTGGACLPLVDSWVSWGPWEPWEFCSVTCGSGTRTRERICYYRGRNSSPLPPDLCACAYPGGAGGSEVESCVEPSCSRFATPPPATNSPVTIPPITLPPQLYQWAEWGDYTACTRTCGSGSRTRSRFCVDLLSNSQVSSALCVGADTETEQCNGQACRSTGSESGYSSWTPCRCETNGSGTRRRVRYQIRCSNADVISTGVCQNQQIDDELCNPSTC